MTNNEDQTLGGGAGSAGARPHGAQAGEAMEQEIVSLRGQIKTIKRARNALDKQLLRLETRIGDLLVALEQTR